MKKKYVAPKFDTPCDVLNATADFFEKTGRWCTGEWVKKNGADPDTYCSLGGLNQIAGVYNKETKGRNSQVLKDAKVRLRRVIGYSSIASWNDVLAGNVDTVVRAMRMAAGPAGNKKE